MKRDIVRIDEDKCNGCGLCVPACHEGAIRIVNGKARLMEDALCDGLGACLGECPQGAITIEAREAAAFDMNKVKAAKLPPMPCGCPGTMARTIHRGSAVAPAAPAAEAPSALGQWPVQLRLINPDASFLAGAELVVSADCVAYAYGDFHRKFLQGKALAIFCPKLDDGLEAYIEKLAMIFRRHATPRVIVLKMEVPCCGGTLMAVEEAVRRSGKEVRVESFTVSLEGEITG
jgi:NAD-dependent dihydropyrimidine dehydrogenase PreA subunit